MDKFDIIDFRKLWRAYNLSDKILMALHFTLHPWKVLFLKYKKVSKDLDIKDPDMLRFFLEIENVDWKKYFTKWGYIEIVLQNCRIHQISSKEIDRIR